MPHSYQVRVPTDRGEAFEIALQSYLRERGFDHMQVGSWLSGDASHEFRRGEVHVSLGILTEGQTDCTLSVQSDTVEIEPLVVHVLMEQAAASLEPHAQAIAEPSRGAVQKLIGHMRASSEEVLPEPS